MHFEDILKIGFIIWFDWNLKLGGKIAGHTYGTWNIPTVIRDEDSFRRDRMNKDDNSVATIRWQIPCSEHFQIEEQLIIASKYLAACVL
jgi:hypothetical protein